jgi:hypothetical protein
MMEFRIADTFIDSLTRLTGEERKAVKTAAFDLQLNPTSPEWEMRVRWFAIGDQIAAQGKTAKVWPPFH